MEVMTLILFLAVSVLISAIVAEITPKVTLPLVQIAFGVIIAVFASHAIEISFEPDLFLVAFIAPLLYIEAKHADKMALWKNLKQVLGLAIVLVIITSFVIGYALNAVDPAISIFAALALGAALGPTDAIAVTSVSKSVDIPEKDMSILQGELLLNDASGIVMFQVAIAAAATGSINAGEASVSFLLEFFGGLGVGIVFGLGSKQILGWARSIGIDSTVFHVLFELCLPFVVYLTSSSVHVSGVIAVVAAGLINPIQTNVVSPAVTRMNIVSDSVWEVVSFALNGVVFVLLGTQIPVAMSYVWADPTFNNLTLLFLIALVTFILLFVRFLWMIITGIIASKKEKAAFSLSELLKHALIMTLSGAKGTVTLSILFTCPLVFSNGTKLPERDLIIFIGCGVILFTLLLATFVLPLVAPKQVITKTQEEERESFILCLQYVLRCVIEQLTASETDMNRVAVREVVRSYQARLENAKSELDEEDSPSTALRLKVCGWQQEKVEELIESGQYSDEACYNVLKRYERVEELLHHASKVPYKRKKVHFPRYRALVIRSRHHIVDKFKNEKDTKLIEEERKIRSLASSYAVQKLKDLMLEDNNVQTEDAAKIVIELETLIMTQTSTLPSVTSQIRVGDALDDVKALAYEIELDAISELQQKGELSRAGAKRMRENVALMQLELNDAF